MHERRRLELGCGEPPPGTARDPRPSRRPRSSRALPGRAPRARVAGTPTRRRRSPPGGRRAGSGARHPAPLRCCARRARARSRRAAHPPPRRTGRPGRGSAPTRRRAGQPCARASAARGIAPSRPRGGRAPPARSRDRVRATPVPPARRRRRGQGRRAPGTSGRRGGSASPSARRAFAVVLAPLRAQHAADLADRAVGAQGSAHRDKDVLGSVCSVAHGCERPRCVFCVALGAQRCGTRDAGGSRPPDRSTAAGSAAPSLPRTR